MSDRPLIDVHVHLGPSDSGEIYYPTFDGEEYLQHAEVAGVVRAYAFPPYRLDGYRAANAALRDWAATTGGRVGAFARLGGPVTPIAQFPPKPWQVRRWARRLPRVTDRPVTLDGFTGVKLLPHLDGMPPRDEMTEIADRRLPVLIHGGRFVTPSWIARRLLPSTSGPVIIAHLGAFPDERGLLDSALALASHHPRLYLDTSGIWNSAFVAEAARVAPGKLVFGSDAPLTTPAVAWAHLRSAIDDAGVLRALGYETPASLGLAPDL